GLTFALSDTLTEIWGKDRAKFVIKLGFAASVISAIMIKLAIMLPSAPFWTNQEAYQLILGSSIKIVVASMVAYLVSQFHDVWAFHFWKKLTKGKYLWIRNNLSTAVSQLIDTVIFITIAFYGTGSPIISMIIGQYTIKLIVAVFDTPLVYLGVNLVKKAISKDESIDNVEYNLS
ncbi:MAG: queuosine precursor transporter, partial [Halanaerobiales bacterium]